MSHDTKESYCAPLPPLSPAFCQAVEPITKFSKWGDLTGPQLLQGDAGKEGDHFFQGGGCNLYIKSKLKSEIMTKIVYNQKYFSQS